MTDNIITTDDLNELALKVVEVSKRKPPATEPRFRVVSRDDEAAWNEAMNVKAAYDAWYRPLADKYGLDVGNVVGFQQMACDWVNTVIDGDYDDRVGTFYDRIRGYIDYVQDEGYEDFSKVDINSLLHEILVMMENDVDVPPPATRTVV